MKPFFPLILLIALVNSFPLSAQIEWKRQYPLEKLEDVLDIDVDADGYGFAAGENDLLLRLDPVTKKWDLLDGFGEEWDFQSIDYLEGSNGTTALAGGDGLIMTTNNGEDWSEIPGAPADIHVVKIFSPTHVIVIASDEVHEWENNVWTDLNVPSLVGIIGGVILNDQSIWAYTSTSVTNMFFTTNGGDTWGSNSDIDNVDAMAFYDAQNGIAMDGRKVYTTTNGGLNWELISDMDILASEDLAYGSSINVIMSASFNGDPEVSTNGGLTWEKLDTDVGTTRLFSVDGISDQEFYLGAKFSSIPHTTDQGDTWEETSGPVRSTIQDMFFLNNSTGFAAGLSGILLRTSNGGNDWEDISYSTRHHYSIHGTSLSNLWLGSAQKISHSIDGGSTWTERFTPPTGGNVNDLAVLPTGVIIGGMSTGYIYRSDDNGLTWDSVYNAITQIRSITIIDGLNVYATGNNGVLLRSNDSGVTWNTIAAPDPALHYEQAFFLDGEGWLVTSSFKQTMWHSVNNGSTWTPLSLPVDRNWEGVYFISPDTGVVVGRNASEGRAYVTYTGGQSWSAGHVVEFPLYGVTGTPNPNGSTWIYGAASDIEVLSYCNTFPVIHAITGNLSPCEGDTLLYTVVSENIDDYIWNFPNTWSILGNPNNDSIYVIAGSVQGPVSVIGQNACGFSEQINVQILVTSFPEIQNLTGDPFPCVGDVISFGISSSGVVTYNWTFPNGWELLTSPNDDEITLRAGNASGIISVSGANTCGSSNTLQLPVDPFEPPVVNVVVTGNLLSLSSTAQSYQWYLDGNIIPGAVNSTYLATEDGLYHAELTYLPAECTGSTDAVEVIITSLGTETVSSVKVYPVPATDILHITGVTGTFHYNIVDVFGKVISTGNAEDGNIEIDQLIRGIYFLNIDQNGERMMAKFIKE